MGNSSRVPRWRRGPGSLSGMLGTGGKADFYTGRARSATRSHGGRRLWSVPTTAATAAQKRGAGPARKVGLEGKRTGDSVIAVDAYDPEYGSADDGGDVDDGDFEGASACLPVHLVTHAARLGLEAGSIEVVDLELAPALIVCAPLPASATRSCACSCSPVIGSPRRAALACCGAASSTHHFMMHLTQL